MTNRTETSEIVKENRHWQEQGFLIHIADWAVLAKAFGRSADRLEELDAENKRLREALRPREEAQAKRIEELENAWEDARDLLKAAGIEPTQDQGG